MVKAELDCTKCGACCMGQLVLLMPADKVPLMMRDDRGVAQMREVCGRCVALRGRLGIDTTCSIYEDRPEICRVLKPGCWACIDIRNQWGLG